MPKYEDLTGQVFGYWTVLRQEFGRFNSRGSRWLCRCKCGTERVVKGGMLRSGKSTSCGCKAKEPGGSLIKDLTGKQFGYWTVLYMVPGEYNTPGTRWMCKCKCGTERIIAAQRLTSGESQSCGCRTKEINSARSFKDITGQKFGRLTVLEFDHMEKSDKASVAYWKCQCDCGNICVKSGVRLRNGQVQSCGCLSLETNIQLMKNTTTHGDSHIRIYHIWRDVIDRCNRETCDKYPRYGGRGIKVCDEWSNPGLSNWEVRRLGNPGFMNFKKWAYENGYYDQPEDTPLGDLLSIERIDVNGNYCPENCTFIPYRDQAKNKRTTQYIYDPDVGDYVIFVDFSRNHNLNENFAHNRMIVSGWSESATIFAGLHPELDLHMVDMSKEANKKHYPDVMGDGVVYIDKDNLQHMIPTIEWYKTKYKKKK